MNSDGRDDIPHSKFVHPTSRVTGPLTDVRMNYYNISGECVTS